MRVIRVFIMGAAVFETGGLYHVSLQIGKGKENILAVFEGTAVNLREFIGT